MRSSHDAKAADFIHIEPSKNSSSNFQQFNTFFDFDRFVNGSNQETCLLDLRTSRHTTTGEMLFKNKKNCLVLLLSSLVQLAGRVFPQGRKWKIKNISSVVTASIHFLDFNGGCTEEVMSNAKEFLEKFKQVTELYIGSQCFEVLSMMVVNGWQLPKFSLQNLTLDCCREYEHIISGIIGMLKSSPDLDTLLLEGYEMDGTIFNLDSAAIGDLDGDLLHLKMIRVDNLADPNGEPLLTLAQILLRRAPALEEMMVMIDVEDANDFVNIGQTLLTYPRSSPKAQIYLISHK